LGSLGAVAKAFWSGSRRRVKMATCSYVPVRGGGGMLLDYGWAILARRSAKGNVVIYDGWRKYSTTTSSHISKLGLYATGRGIRHSHKRPRLLSAPFPPPYGYWYPGYGRKPRY